MRALVTGAGGHIGSHVVRAARDAGIEPIALVRAGSDRRALAGLGVEERVGDLLDAASLRSAMEVVELVFHVAAAHRNYSADPQDIIRPAIEGTQNVLAAARGAGVRRIVYTSTGATVGFTSDPEKALTEDDFLETAEAPYARAKIEAERLVRDAAKTGDLELVILNPSGVFGPLDYKITPATQALVGLAGGDPVFLHLSVTDVRDLASCHVLAATKGASGRRYLATGPVVRPAEMRALCERVTGIRPMSFTPPRFLANLGAAAMEAKARITRSDAKVTRAIVNDAFGKHLVYDSTRARTELGATFRAAEDTLRDAYRWLLFVDALPPRAAAKVRARMGADAAPDPSWVR